MKKIASLFISTFFLLSPAYGDDTPLDDSNWGIQHRASNTSESQNISPSEQAWNETIDTAIYDQYGSEYSPAFSNRENMNPNESDYGYGTADGVN